VACYGRTGLRFTHGLGARLFTEAGQSFLDFLSGIGVNSLGHVHPGLTKAIQAQAERFLHISNLYDHPLQEAFASRLAQACSLDQVFFCNSGAEAIEAGLKMARRFQFDRGEQDRTAFLALEGSFHGRTLGALSCTSNPNYRRPFAPLIHQVDFVPHDDIDSLERALESGRYAALLIEPIQGESGVLPLSVLFLKEARRISQETGTLLLFDEIQCGGGRTGSFLHSSKAGVTPDLVTLAKPIAAGLPVGATVVTKQVGEHLVPGDHGSTFGGGPLVCAAGLFFMEELLDRGLLARVVEAGVRFAEGLDRLVSKFDHVLSRRGDGLMQALVLSTESGPVNAMLQERGLLANACGGTALRFLPPYIVSDDDIDEALGILEDVLGANHKPPLPE
jgi:acetylornithine/N-succinyldiaminopimelate aminotransferase